MPPIRSLALALVLIGCTDIGSAPTPSATPTLLPRPQATASATVEHEIGIAPVDTVGPSPTPHKHVIVEGDTLLSIAIRYGVELAELLLANPGVNPRLLVIGDGLSIPRSGAQGPVPSATPVPVELSQVACYEAIPAGLTCLLTAAVSGDSAVEGVVALVTLADSTGQALQTEPAYGSTNLVLPGSRLPLAATFGQPEPRFSFASAVAISALNAREIDSRYVELDLQIQSSVIASDGQSARATGTVELKGELQDRPVGLRLVVLALGKNDIPVGYRIWEASKDGFSFGFDITVFSLGPPIEKVEILSEAPYLP
ncbi:MAG: LysM peptidoglycan-binding domain-containing protein [Chloroflexi bacterium]|nr:LysM peptidoglycan-binding domain-containing protein [Chloroflexota bacterium]